MAAIVDDVEGDRTVETEPTTKDLIGGSNDGDGHNAKHKKHKKGKKKSASKSKTNKTTKPSTTTDENDAEEDVQSMTKKKHKKEKTTTTTQSATKTHKKHHHSSKKNSKNKKKNKKTPRANSMASEGESTISTIQSMESMSLQLEDQDPPAETSHSPPSEDIIGSLVGASTTSSTTSTTSNTNTNSKTKSLQKKVSFDEVTVDEFEYAIGRTHVTKLGPPISIATSPISSTSYKVDEYEKERSTTRRGDDHLLLPARSRIELLQQLGYTQHQIQQAVNDSEHVRDRRKRSVLNMQYDTLAFTTERIGRKVTKLAKSPHTLLQRTFSGSSNNSNGNRFVVAAN